MGAEFLDELTSAGLKVSRDGDRLVVAPRDRLTDELRETIKRRKTELLAAIYCQERPNLGSRIRAMARRWGYSSDELADALIGAQSDPLAWIAWTERDERDFGGCVTPEDFARAYRKARGLQ